MLIILCLRTITGREARRIYELLISLTISEYFSEFLCRFTGQLFQVYYLNPVSRPMPFTLSLNDDVSIISPFYRVTNHIYRCRATILDEEFLHHVHSHKRLNILSKNRIFLNQAEIGQVSEFPDRRRGKDKHCCSTGGHRAR